MTNVKAQMSSKVQNPNNKKVVLAFRHLGFNCHLDLFRAWILGFGI
jgi:hypothetical protein